MNRRIRGGASGLLAQRSSCTKRLLFPAANLVTMRLHSESNATDDENSHPSTSSGSFWGHKPQGARTGWANVSSLNSTVKQQQQQPQRRQHQTHSAHQVPQTLEGKLQKRFGLHCKLTSRLASLSAAATSNNVRDDGDAEGRDEPSAPASAHGANSYRANVVFKQLGFPVEIAVATSDVSAEDAEQRAFENAMATNILFVSPTLKENHPNSNPQLLEIKRVVDDLRQLCQKMGRVLKFSVKPKLASRPQSENNSDTAVTMMDGPQWFGCRAYVKDDWTSAHLSFFYETKSVTPNDALVKCFSAVRDRFHREFTSDAYIREEYAEAERMLKLKGKTVSVQVVRCNTPVPHGSIDNHQELDDEGEGEAMETVSSDGAPPAAQRQQGSASPLQKALGEASGAAAPGVHRRSSPSPPSERDADATVVAVVTDANGNTYEVRSDGHTSLLEAYRDVATQIFEREAEWDQTLVERAPSLPMLLKLKNQVEGMAYYIHELRGGVGIPPHDFVRFDFSEVTPLSNQSSVRSVSLAPSGAQVVSVNHHPTGSNDHDIVVSTKAYKYVGKAFFDGKEVASSEGFGPYRVHFDVYVQLLSAMLDAYPEVAQYHFAHCFPTMETLERAVYHHDHYRLFNHKGKWTCYSVLSSITLTLFGSNYDKIFFTFDHSTNPSTRSECRVVVNDGVETQRLLSRRFCPNVGNAFRSACMDAIRHNFPQQYEIATQHAEFDTNSEAHIGHRLKALPREKRIGHLNQIYGIIGLFAEEDYGWTSLRIRTRCVGKEDNRWVAELEALVQGESQRRIVATSPIAVSSKVARRVLIYNVCKQFFPKELAQYEKMGRCDAANPEAQDSDMARVYRAGTPFFAQVLALLDKAQPDLAPFSWRVVRVPPDPINNKSDAAGAHDASTSSLSWEDDTGSSESLTKELYLRYKATVFGNQGDVVVAERIGNEGEGALAVVRSVLKGATEAFASPKMPLQARELWREFECSHAAVIQSTQELCEFVMQMSIGGLGGGDGSSRDAAVTGSATTQMAVGSTASLSADASPRSSAETQVVARSVAKASAYLQAKRQQQQQLKNADCRIVEKVCDVQNTTVSTLSPSFTSAAHYQLHQRAAIDVEFALLHDSWWVATMIMPNMHNIPIARAAAKSKREAHKHVWMAAAKSNFSKQLRHYSKHHLELQAFADEVFHELILPAPPIAIAKGSVHVTGGKTTVGGQAMPKPKPYQLMCSCVHAAFPHHRVVVEQETPVDGSVGYVCRIYRQPTAVMATNDAGGESVHERASSSSRELQVVMRSKNAVELGYGRGLTKTQALHIAALAVLEAHYSAELEAAIRANADFAEFAE